MFKTISGFIGTPQFSANYESVREVGNYSEGARDSKFIYLGTPGTNPLVASALAELNVSLSPESAALGDRSYPTG